MKLLKPDATTDGKLIFNFMLNGEVLIIVKEVTDYKKATLTVAKDAAVILKDRAGTPVIKCTYTMPATGRAAKTSEKTTPASAELAAGDILDLYITASGSGTGTGYVDVILLYTIN